MKITKKKIIDYTLITLLFLFLNVGGIIFFIFINIVNESVDEKKSIELLSKILGEIDNLELDEIILSRIKTQIDIVIQNINRGAGNLYDTLASKEKIYLGFASLFGVVSSIGFTFKLIGSKIEDVKDIARHKKRKEIDSLEII